MSIVFPTTIASTYIGQQAQGGNSVYTTSTGLFTGTSVVHVFTSTGTNTFTANNFLSIAYLIVAGGGSGASVGASVGGGGGGAGGMLTGTATLLAGSYAVVVGAGAPPTASNSGNGTQGQPSSIASISTATGGGAGGGPGTGGPGGSGGGQSKHPGFGTGIPGQGYPGGTGSGNYGVNPVGGGGGGGAGSAGGCSPSAPTGGTGGSGQAWSITGASVTYAVGGGGGNTVTTPGTTGPGYGGGGGGGAGGPGGTPGDPGGAGGPGIVVISYAYTATIISSVPNGYKLTTSTYLGTETWTYNTATNRWWSTQEPSQQYTLTPSLIEDQATTSTGYIDFPYGTTAQRPQGPTPGYMRFNTDLGLMEYYNTSGTWVQIPAQNT